jgi:hypothetical protein
MKKLIKLPIAIAFVLILAFAMTGCDGDGGGGGLDDGGGGGDGGGGSPPGGGAPVTPPVVDEPVITPISSVAINVISPLKGENPITIATGTGNFTIGSVSWNPGHNPFEGSTSYTATVTLAAESGFTFTGLGSAAINGNPASSISNNTGNNVTLSYTFLETSEKMVSGISIISQPSNPLTYIHGDTLNLSGLVARITYTDTTTEDVALADFAGKSMSANPAHNQQLVRLVHNSQPVVVSLGSHTANTGNLSVNQKNVSITGFNITRAFNGTNTVYSFGSLSFNGLASGESATVSTWGVTATYGGTLVGQHNITFSGSFGMTGGNAVPSNYTITQPTGITGTITVATPSAPNAPGLGTVTHNSVTLTEPTSIYFLHSHLSMEYAFNTINSTPSTGWQEGLTFSGLTPDTNYFFFVRYRVDATKNNVSVARSLQVRTSGIPVTLISVIANGDPNADNETHNTTQLILTFSEVIPGLSTNDISINGVRQTWSLLSGSGSTYTLSISSYPSRELSVGVEKSGYSISGSPKTVTTNFHSTPGLEYTPINSGTAYSVSRGTMFSGGGSPIPPVVIPATYNGLPVTAIADGGFSSSRLGTIIIPDSVTSIGNGAFSHNHELTSITIPNSVTNIGSAAFASTGLTSLPTLGSVTSIGDRMFFRCENLRNITIPNNITSIGSEAFLDCFYLTSVTIPNSVTSIGNSAFENCIRLTSVSIGNSVINIGNNAFRNTGLTSITIPGSVRNIGSYAFFSCFDLTDITILNGMTSIGNFAFAGCVGLTSVTIPNSVTNIGEHAFLNCYYLNNIRIGANVNVSPNAFLLSGTVRTSRSSFFIVNEAIDYFYYIYNNGRFAGTYTRVDASSIWTRN